MSTSSPCCVPWEAPTAFEQHADGSSQRIVVDPHTPASLAEQTELEESEDENERLRQVLQWLFHHFALRADGELHEPNAMALRVCYLGSLLQIEPLASLSYKQIGEKLGYTRAMVSKVALELGAICGIHSRIQRSPQARVIYSKRAKRVHARPKKEPDASAKTPGSNVHHNSKETPSTVSPHEQ